MTNIGCILPMLIQMPIWIALYQSIIRILATGPEELLNLSRYLYSSWHIVFPMVPLNSQFLWLNLGSPDTFLYYAYPGRRHDVDTAKNGNTPKY